MLQEISLGLGQFLKLQGPVPVEWSIRFPLFSIFSLIFVILSAFKDI